MPKFPNPPLTDICVDDLMTRRQAAEQFGISPETIDLWVKRGKLDPLPLGPGEPVFHADVIAEAELDAWCNGAHRRLRGGRPAGWRPGMRAAA